MFKFKKNVNILVQAGSLKMPRHAKNARYKFNLEVRKV